MCWIMGALSHWGPPGGWPTHFKLRSYAYAWPHTWPFKKIFKSDLEPSRRDLSNAASPVSLRSSVCELAWGGGASPSMAFGWDPGQARVNPMGVTWKDWGQKSMVPPVGRSRPAASEVEALSAEPGLNRFIPYIQANSLTLSSSLFQTAKIKKIFICARAFGYKPLSIANTNRNGATKIQASTA